MHFSCIVPVFRVLYVLLRVCVCVCASILDYTAYTINRCIHVCMECRWYFLLFRIANISNWITDMCEHHFKCIDLIVLQISTKQLQISLKELEISAILLQISVIELLISINELVISIHEYSTSLLFILFKDICKRIADICKRITDIFKYLKISVIPE